MLYREIIAVCSEIHTKHINTLCGQNAELLSVTATGGTYCTVTAGLEKEETVQCHNSSAYACPSSLVLRLLSSLTFLHIRLTEVCTNFAQQIAGYRVKRFLPKQNGACRCNKNSTVQHEFRSNEVQL
jgi:hypothetical protein